MITFINREEDLAFLEEAFAGGKFELVPIYGRRRIGKTELILQFIKNKKSIYFLATAGTKRENIGRFKAAAKGVVDLSFVRDDWEAIFEYLKNLGERLVVVIDEFPYLLETEKGLSSIFQAIVDLHLKDSKVFLILSGSSLGMMYREVLTYRAPLYGRRTGQIHLRQLAFRDVVKFFDKPLEEVIRIYAICGGIPAYLNEFREKRPLFRLVEERILRRDAVLREEAPFLLRQELRDPKIYMAVLSAISLGYRSLGKIINYCGFSSKTSIMPYLHSLEYLDYIRREVPVTETPRSKKGLYFINDNFFSFWFRFVRGNLSIIEMDTKKGIEEIKRDFNSYLGFVFEDVCKQFLLEGVQKTYDFARIGRWWHGEVEIDWVMLDEGKREIMFVECKWQDNVDAGKILKELIEKAGQVDWHREQRKEYYCIIAKSFRTKVEDALCFDLTDIEKCLGQ